MESKLDERIKDAYEEYLKLPKHDRYNPTQEDIYSNWCVLTGRSIISPHPHRHYTLLEFAYWRGLPTLKIVNEEIEKLSKTLLKTRQWMTSWKRLAVLNARRAQKAEDELELLKELLRIKGLVDLLPPEK